MTREQGSGDLDSDEAVNPGRRPWQVRPAVRRRPALLPCMRGLVAATLVCGAAGATIASTAGLASASPSGIITTVVGGDARGPLPAKSVALEPNGLVAMAGNLYMSDDTLNGLREVHGGGSEVVVAGNGTTGFSGDGGWATRAEMNDPGGIAMDHWGNLVVADSTNDRVRVVARKTGTFYGVAMTAGRIYTVAGNGVSGYSGDGGPATSAELFNPDSVAVDHWGNLVVADSINNRIRVVARKPGTFYGIAMTAGDIYTVAGNGSLGFSGDGGPATSAQLDDPSAVAVDGSGNLVMADSANNRLRVVADKSGTFYGVAMTAGDIYTVAGKGTAGYSGDGGPATSAKLDLPLGVNVDGAGNLLVADTFNNRVRVVAGSTGTFYGKAMTAGDIYTVAGNGSPGCSPGMNPPPFVCFGGDGGPATSAKLGAPSGVAVDALGNLLVADYHNARVRVVAEKTGTFYGVAMTPGDIYTVAGNGSYQYSGDGGPATSAELDSPGGVAVDGTGNVVVADKFNNRVRVLARKTGTFYGVAMTAGDIYTVAGDGNPGPLGNGGPATSAGLHGPSDVAVDGAGNLIVADSFNNRVRVVAEKTGTFYGMAMTAGDIYTVALVGEPIGVAVDSAGNLVAADAVDNQVGVVAGSTGTFYGIAMTVGNVYTIAGNGTAGFSGDGGPATSGELDNPSGVAVDGSGNVVVTDTANNRLRVVAEKTGTFYGVAMTAGDIYSVAGNGTGGYAGDGGPATSAELDNPIGLTVGGAGNVLVADSANNRVRVVAVHTGRFYGVHMTSGRIYTIAGTGTGGYSGDGGPATSAELNYPSGVAVSGSGNLLIADATNNRVRLVAGSH
jgi:trimeric autotransporter adhesin